MINNKYIIYNQARELISKVQNGIRNIFLLNYYIIFIYLNYKKT